MNNANHSATAEQLLSVDAPYFCCGLVLVNDHAIRTAPIVRYMLGWHRNHIERYCRSRGWRVEMVDVIWRKG